MIVIFGVKPKRRAVDGDERERRSATAVPWSPTPSEATEKAEQLVGLIMKFGRLMLTWISRIRIGIPPMISGTVSESAITWASEWVDVQGDPDHDGAVVIGAGEGRGDRDQAERRALEGAGQVDLADRVEGVGARAGGDVGGADFTRGRAARVGLLDFAQGVGRREDVGLGAVGDAVQVGGQARAAS